MKKRTEQVKKDIPILDLFGLPSLVFDFQIPWFDVGLIYFTVVVVVPSPASFGGFVGVRLAMFVCLWPVGGTMSGWWVVVLRPCLVGHCRCGCRRKWVDKDRRGVRVCECGQRVTGCAKLGCG